MIYNYGFSITGKSHLQTETPCQDAHYIRQLENGWFVGAAADGVGSCSQAEEGSALAVKTAVDFVCDYMPYDYSVISIKSMLRTAFNHTMKTIIRHAEEKNLPIENFDTTLSLVIYDGKRIIYAHSGDGAVIGLTAFGEVVEITKRQKAEDGVSLVPLRAGYEAWEIDVYEEELAGVLIVTDGVLDAVSPYLLKTHADEVPDYAGGSGLYVPLVSYFADPAGIPEEEECQAVLKESMEAFLTGDPDFDSKFFYERLETIYRSRVPDRAAEFVDGLKAWNYPLSLMQASQDDKTVVGFLNTDTFVEPQAESYYKEADWPAYQEVWDRMAYPGLYPKAENPNREEKEEANEEHVIIKWMKRFTRLEPAAEKADKDCGVKKDEGSDVLQ